MIVSWRIRYLDRSDRKFKDRDLFLDTDLLEPVMKAAVELILEAGRRKREILKYRGLFRPTKAGDLQPATRPGMKFDLFALPDYLEDELGIELTSDEVGRILTGSPTAISIPRGAEQHDIDLMLAEWKPMPIAEIALPAEDLKLLGYFVRDFRELSTSAFMKDGPGTMTTGGASIAPGDWLLVTSVTDDEIRSFVMIFRRLYMEGEPANFLKALAAFSAAMGDHPYGKWAKGVGKSFRSKLENPIETRPFLSIGKCSFTSKRLIDVFLYTQYSHQPDDRRRRQFNECLNEVNGRSSVLTSLFLSEMWHSALTIKSAGRLIANWFDRYCKHHQLSPDVLLSLRLDNPGIGAGEKKADLKARLFREKAEELAMEMWNRQGRPSGGPTIFFREAQEQLSDVLKDGAPATRDSGY